MTANVKLWLRWDEIFNKETIAERIIIFSMVVKSLSENVVLLCLVSIDSRIIISNSLGRSIILPTRGKLKLRSIRTIKLILFQTLYARYTLMEYLSSVKNIIKIIHRDIPKGKRRRKRSNMINTWVSHVGRIIQHYEIKCYYYYDHYRKGLEMKIKISQHRGKGDEGWDDEQLSRGRNTTNKYLYTLWRWFMMNSHRYTN